MFSSQLRILCELCSCCFSSDAQGNGLLNALLSKDIQILSMLFFSSQVSKFLKESYSFSVLGEYRLALQSVKRYLYLPISFLSSSNSFKIIRDTLCFCTSSVSFLVFGCCTSSLSFLIFHFILNFSIPFCIKFSFFGNILLCISSFISNPIFSV